ncbi:MAG: hypothetical protein ACRC45_03705, partial [Cetobacterium sp.]
SEDEVEALNMGEMMNPGFKEKAIQRKSGEVKGDRISETRLICPHENTLVVEEAIGITPEVLNLYKTILANNETPKKKTPEKQEVVSKSTNSIVNETDFGSVFG